MPEYTTEYVEFVSGILTPMLAQMTDERQQFAPAVYGWTGPMDLSSQPDVLMTMDPHSDRASQEFDIERFTSLIGGVFALVPLRSAAVLTFVKAYDSETLGRMVPAVLIEMLDDHDATVHASLYGYKVEEGQAEYLEKPHFDLQPQTEADSLSPLMAEIVEAVDMGTRNEFPEDIKVSMMAHFTTAAGLIGSYVAFNTNTLAKIYETEDDL